MKPDLKSMTRKQLEKLSADIDKALARVSKTEMKAALAAAEKAAKAHGFSLAEIAPGIGPKEGPKKKIARKPKKPGSPKYANPDDKTQTWTGKGRRPDWFLAAMEAGKSPDDLAI
ncbi:H-NS histone family protein [Loktanella sp. Alg231-35]|uniref:H-NS histone family protein n=1 Tax=Loktanella sp. Alg231-35 TaxID=1922220 RepID=UPI000D555AB8|nr:H-NS histone family protein [Loktanella sp. Alg231-35]